ncbi:hypothetical protein PF005_g8654 [Phytophthora fragariae]|uniref:Uncharacterized protein n=1 Tax=Phytophthora fragariae TaxID=53985 RepID=A0A6A3UKW8_9STRA|nr:hypothetical protein PF003_g40313 [Phytophthora fragariae]KAE8940315.1 hypothetical protein PF009_g9869 [Phytophthora fragariae]KAE9014752.1 hypothetical protein PF011_g7917 [Phytophthora fragariae]KAE9118172.1 hypothetical protein PF007_g9018 [Phytophthora fragariae]KAE9147682.1 hypothetical protein PF006_g7657 [Phytophthora fragariae]
MLLHIIILIFATDQVREFFFICQSRLHSGGGTASTPEHIYVVDGRWLRLSL